MRSTAFRRRSRSSSAPAAAAARARSRRSPRSIISCACCTSSSARSIARTATCRSSRRASAAIAARLLRDYRGKRITLLAPLVVARKGFYTDLAKWAAKKGFTHAAGRWGKRADRRMAAPVALSRAHDRAAGGARSRSARRGDARCTRRCSARSTSAKASCTCSAAKAQARRGIFDASAPARPAARGFAELDPRLFSFNSKHGWCESCFGTGLAMSGFDAEQTGEEIWWNEWYERRAARLHGCDGQRAQPGGAQRALPRALDRRACATQPIAGVAQASSRSSSLRRARASIARDLLAEIRAPPAVPRARRPGLSAARPRRAHALRRRGTAHPPCRPARLESARGVLRTR